jgi:alcohol dehydrogenase class IV
MNKYKIIRGIDGMIWSLKKSMYRVNQKVMKLVAGMLKFPEQQLLTGTGCLKDLPEVVRSRGVNNVLIVTDKVLMSLKKLDGLFESLHKSGIKYAVYDDVQPNPTIDNIENARKMYLENKCEGIIAFGGGSPMDCAKAAAARVTNSGKSVREMRGMLKVGKPLPPLFAVPTTAGTGSETTVAAVVTDPSTHEKYAITDLKLTPQVAVLDPELTVGLPPHITSTTGMDALTHAVEAYVGQSGTKFTDENAEKAVKIIFDRLEQVYKDGSDIESRSQMALASYYAGAAFTRAYVGYVHAIAHNLGGLYGVPHGLANAVILPYILEYYGESVERKLARLADAGGIGSAGESEKELAARFVERVKEMNRNMNIPEKIKEIKEEDIPLIARRALKEANPGYPVPKIMNLEECMAIVRKLLVEP